jgi:hypothetical protein
MVLSYGAKHGVHSEYIADSCSLSRTSILPTSREEALDSFTKNDFFRSWDPEVLKIYVECGTTPSRDSSGDPVICLKMPGIHEAVVFSETHTECEVYQRLQELDERIELRWIMPGHIQATE